VSACDAQTAKDALAHDGKICYTVIGGETFSMGLKDGNPKNEELNKRKLKPFL